MTFFSPRDSLLWFQMPVLPAQIFRDHIFWYFLVVEITINIWLPSCPLPECVNPLFTTVLLMVFSAPWVLWGILHIYSTENNPKDCLFFFLLLQDSCTRNNFTYNGDKIALGMFGLFLNKFLSILIFYISALSVIKWIIFKSF